MKELDEKKAIGPDGVSELGAYTQGVLGLHRTPSARERNA